MKWGGCKFSERVEYPLFCFVNNDCFCNYREYFWSGIQLKLISSMCETGQMNEMMVQ